MPDPRSKQKPKQNGKKKNEQKDRIDSLLDAGSGSTPRNKENS